MKTLTVTHDLEAFVDDEDYPRCSKYKWYPKTSKDGSYYVVRSCGKETGHPKKQQSLQNFIMGYPDEGYLWDHKNRIKHDCAKDNLRKATPEQNGWNTPPGMNAKCDMKGVHITGDGNFQSTITANKITYHLGTYDTKEDAGLIFDIFAKIHHKEFAYLNFPNATQEQCDELLARIEVRGSKRKLKNKTCEYWGVHKERNSFVSVLCHERREIHLGTFKEKEHGAMAHDIAVIMYKGEIINLLNFPERIDEYRVFIQNKSTFPLDCLKIGFKCTPKLKV